jgi:uncharacterized membrane protein YqhA
VKLQNIFGLLLKFFTFLAVLGIILLAIGVYLYSFYEIYKVIKTILFETPKEGEVILQSLKAIDAVLLGVIFFIIGLGLFELFISPIDNLPDWFKMKNLDQLKAMLIKVIVVVMGVSFTGKIVTWDGTTDLLNYGLGLGVVIFALSYFLNVKMQKEKAENDREVIS